MTKKNHREKLRRLAKAATPGPWVADGLEGTLDSLSTGRRVAEVTMWPEVDAVFIAAANPATVLGLLDRLEHMTEARDNARAEVERLTALVAEVRALHYGEYVEDEDRNRCLECGDDAPCPTIRALDGSES